MKISFDFVDVYGEFNILKFKLYAKEAIMHLLCQKNNMMMITVR